MNNIDIVKQFSHMNNAFNLETRQMSNSASDFGIDSFFEYTPKALVSDEIDLNSNLFYLETNGISFKSDKQLESEGVEEKDYTLQRLLEFFTSSITAVKVITLGSNDEYSHPLLPNVSFIHPSTRDSNIPKVANAYYTNGNVTTQKRLTIEEILPNENEIEVFSSILDKIYKIAEETLDENKETADLIKPR
jgi:hypothetical protein